MLWHVYSFIKFFSLCVWDVDRELTSASSLYKYPSKPGLGQAKSLKTTSGRASPWLAPTVLRPSPVASQDMWAQFQRSRQPSNECGYFQKRVHFCIWQPHSCRPPMVDACGHAHWNNCSYSEPLSWIPLLSLALSECLGVQWSSASSLNAIHLWYLCQASIWNYPHSSKCMSENAM